MMATVPHVTSGLGLRKFQADGFLLTRVYKKAHVSFHAVYGIVVLLKKLAFVDKCYKNSV